MPVLPQEEALKLIQRRHPTWAEFQLHWRQMLDSLEGGSRYRNAIYGIDKNGFPVRNLMRHKKELPDPKEFPSNQGSWPAGIPGVGTTGVLQVAGGLGSDPYSMAAYDDFEMRRARTPVPTFVRENLEKDLSKIYSREVTRVADDVGLNEWWANIDGCDTSIDDWMQDVVAPLLVLLGQIDILFDNPPKPKGRTVESLADVKELALDKCRSSIIIPENMLWYERDEFGYYTQCVVQEWRLNPAPEPDKNSPIDFSPMGMSRAAAQQKKRDETKGVDVSVPYFRWWTEYDSTLFDREGQVHEEPVTHKFKRVPIVRVYDHRKYRTKDIGQSRYENVGEKAREYYNRDSELILSDSQQAHPLLQGPEEYVQADGSVPIGPGFLLPMKKDSSKGTYAGFNYVDPPKGAAESIRQNKADIREDVDREMHTVKAAGSMGTAKGTVEQSGVSKSIDHQECHARLVDISRKLRKAEETIVEFVTMVLNQGEPLDPEDFDVVYPVNFDLYSASDLATVISDWQNIVMMTGAMPYTDGLMLKKLVRFPLTGLDDAEYALVDAEIVAFMAAGGGIALNLAQQAASADATGSTPPKKSKDGTELKPAGNTRDKVNPSVNKYMAIPGSGAGGGEQEPQSVGQRGETNTGSSNY